LRPEIRKISSTVEGNLLRRDSDITINLMPDESLLVTKVPTAALCRALEAFLSRVNTGIEKST
jgi:hypothetical protein